MIIEPKNWETFQHYKDRSPAWIKLHRSLLDDYEFSQLPVESRALAPMLWLLASEGECGKIDASVDKLAFRLRMKPCDVEFALAPLLDGGFFVPSNKIRPKEKWASRYVSDELKTRVLERDGHKCVSCKSDENLEIDHKTPVSRGGKSTYENLQVLCRSCNRSKRTKSAEQFATQSNDLRSLEKRREEKQVREEKKTSDKESDDSDFEDFYKKYPRHEGRGQAEKAYACAIKIASKDELLAGLDRALEIWRDTPKKFIPLPATWLNGKRWQDELESGATGKPYRIEDDPAYRGVTW